MPSASSEDSACRCHPTVALIDDLRFGWIRRIADEQTDEIGGGPGGGGAVCGRRERRRCADAGQVAGGSTVVQLQPVHLRRGDGQDEGLRDEVHRGLSRSEGRQGVRRHGVQEHDPGPAAATQADAQGQRPDAHLLRRDHPGQRAGVAQAVRLRQGYGFRDDRVGGGGERPADDRQALRGVQDRRGDSQPSEALPLLGL